MLLNKILLTCLTMYLGASTRVCPPTKQAQVWVEGRVVGSKAHMYMYVCMYVNLLGTCMGMSANTDPQLPLYAYAGFVVVRENIWLHVYCLSVCVEGRGVCVQGVV